MSKAQNSKSGGGNRKKGNNKESCVAYRAAGRQEFNAKRKQIKHRRMLKKHEEKAERVRSIREKNAEKKEYKNRGFEAVR